MTNQPQPGNRARALTLLEAAEFMRDAHFRDGLTVQEITTALAHTVDRADAMVGSLSRDGFGAEEIAEMLSAEPAAVSAAVAPPTQAAPSLRAGLRDEIVKALGRITTVPPVAHRREQADHVLAVLYREWPWLRAEAEDAEPTDRAAVLRWAADAIDAETRQAKADGVLEPDKYRPCRDASAQLRRMADETATETQRRCPSCDHEAKYHAADDGRCWFTVDHGAPGANLVCPCIPRDPGDDEPAAGARQDGAES